VHVSLDVFTDDDLAFLLDCLDRVVARWLCTRTGAQPIVVHAGWRTDSDVAASVALAASTEGARTPVPLQEARRVAREMRAMVER
jgi:hypothetical protein